MASTRRIIFFTTLSKNLLSHRSISTTIHLNQSWMNKIKGAFTGQKTNDSTTKDDVTSQSFTLFKFADELKNARKLGTFKQYMVGRSSEATFADAFEKQEAIIRFLGGYDPSGDNIQPSQKQEAAKKLNCTIAEVENTLAKFTWAKEAQRKIEKLKEEGKPMPKSLAELFFLMMLLNQTWLRAGKLAEMHSALVGLRRDTNGVVELKGTQSRTCVCALEKKTR